MRNHEECKEEMIELLTTVSEVVWGGRIIAFRYDAPGLFG